MAPCAPSRPAIVSACLFVLSIVGLAPAAWAQATISTVVGQPEVTAVAFDPQSGAVYYASDRPAAIYRIANATSSPTLVAGVPGGSTADGVSAAQAAVFPGRNGLAIDAGGNVFFSEPSLHRIRRIDAATGIVSTIAGTGHNYRPDPSYVSGNGAIYTDLAAPGALAFNPVTGDLMAADETWDIVYRLTTNGAGPISGANAVAVRAVGGDTASTDIFVDYYWYNPFGYAGDGGPAIDAKLNHPRGLAFDAAGNLYIADTGNHVVRRVDTNGMITTIAGTGTAGFAGDGDLAVNAKLFMPEGLGIEPINNYLFIADTANHRLRRVELDTGYITTAAGDGVARLSRYSLAYPSGVAVLANGATVIADSQNGTVAGLPPGDDQTLVLATVAGSPAGGYVGDGAPGGDALNQPLSVVFDAAGNMFFSDSGNARVRRMDASTQAVTTVVGSGIPGYGGDGGLATQAMLNCPAGLSFGAAGDLFVADPCANVVRKVSPGADGLVKGDPDEVITTFAGTGVRYGNGDGDGGSATSARLDAPGLVAADSTGRLYIGEIDAADVRVVTTDGVIQTYTLDIGQFAMTVDSRDNLILAMNGEGTEIDCGYSRILLPADLGLSSSFTGMALDPLGRLYLSDGVNAQYLVRLAPSSGSFCDATEATLQTATIAGIGDGTIGYSGDGGSSVAATFNGPAGIALNGTDDLFIADSGNNVIRRVSQPAIGVSLDRTSLDFGVQGLQIRTSPVTVTVTSTGTQAVTFTASTLAGDNPGDFAIVTDGCSGVALSQGSTCQISVTFTPTVVGSRAGVLHVNDDATGAPQTVTLTGQGASLAVVPSPIAFGNQTVAVASTPVHVIVTNQAASPISVSSLALGGVNSGDYAISQDTCSGTALPALSSCTFSVTFTPQSAGPSSATVTIASSADARQIDLGGTGVSAVAAVGLSPQSVAFGTVNLGSSSTGTVITVTSTGTAPLQVASVVITGNQPADFVVSANSCSGAILAPSQTCTVTVAFTPQEICSSTAALAFSDNAPGSPQNVALTGQGAGGAAGSFEATLYCTSHAAQPREMAPGVDGNVWFVEAGSIFAPPAIARANAQAGVFSEDSGVVQNGSKPSGLAIAPDGSYAYYEAPSNPNNQIYLDIVNPAGVTISSPTSFVGPFGVGPDNGFWMTHVVTCGADVDVFPVATDFAPTGVTTDYWTTSGWIFANTNGYFCLGPSVVATGPDGTLWIGSGNNEQLASTQPNGWVRVSRAGDVIDFAKSDAQPLAAAIGADGHMYALVEAGANVCALRRFDAQGQETSISNGASIVSLGCSSLAAGPDHRLWMTGQGAFNGTSFPLELVAFDPTTGAMTGYPVPQLGFITSYLTAGPDEGIWFDAVPSAVGRFDIGGGPSRAFVTPSTASFAPTGVGLASGAQAITVLSTGTAPLVIGSISIAGGDAGEFQVVPGACAGASLAPGTSCTIVVTSQPTHPGSHSATLVITDNDGFSPQTVRLEEYVVPGPPTVSPSQFSFPTTAVGQQSASRAFTLKNNGDRPLHVQFAGKDGTDAADFPILSDTCSNADVPVGGTCKVVVAFKPLTAGTTKTATLTFNDAANPPQQVVTLSGGAQTTGGGSGGGCACSKTGTFVEPALKKPVTGAMSPDSKFTLTVTDQLGETHLTVNKNGSTFADIVVPAGATWEGVADQQFGFSPDGDRFVVHYQKDGLDWIQLYDLTSQTPVIPVWTNEGIPINPGGTATSPSGSMAFSPHGDYLLATVLQTPALGSQQLFLFLVSASGAEVGSTPTFQWTPSAAPKNKAVTSAHWGFGPDDQSFVMVRQAAGDQSPRLALMSLPSGTLILDQSFPDSSWYVQFSPCGDVLGAVTDDGTHETAHLFSTTKPVAGVGELGNVPDLGVPETDPPTPITMTAGPANFTVNVPGGSFVLAPNTAAAGCAAATSTGSAGGSGTPVNYVAAEFTSGHPPDVGFEGVPYTFTFTATGNPDPTFKLESGPSWLSIDPDTGVLTGTPPVGTTSFDYTVSADNSLNNPTLSPSWHVTVTPPNPPSGGGGGPGGPYADDDDEEGLDTALEPAQASSNSPDQNPLPAPADLILPNGRGDILLAADVTPAVSVFTYTETDAPSAPLTGLVFAGLDFTLTAVDAASGAPVTGIVDAARATLVFSADELRAVRITDPSRLGVYWWSGTAWVNQLPCAGCGYNVASQTLTVALGHIGEYALAAVPAPAPTLTIGISPIAVTVGTPFSGTVASFAPGDPQDDVNQYAAVVDWGDGQTSTAAVTSDSGAFTVSAAHTWNAAGTYPVTVTVYDIGYPQSGQGNAIVAPAGTPPQFTAAAPPLTATAGAAYSYTFGASGDPAPAFALAAGAPSWLSIDAGTGVLTGTVPTGTTSFAYSVVASNGVTPDATAGPFSVTVASASNGPADLSVTIGAPRSARRGSTVTYSIVVRNTGPSTAVNGTLVFLAGPVASFVSADPPPVVNVDGFWAWTFAALDPGQSATFTLEIDANRAEILVAAAAVGADSRDPKLANNAAAALTVVK